MRLSFRHRLFVGLVMLSAAPLAVAVVVLAMQANASSSPAGPRTALDEIAASGRNLASRVDTLLLTPDGVAALREHSNVIAQRTTLARRAETLTRLSAAALAIVVAISGVGLVAGSVFLAQRWSRSFSQPIENLIGWIQRIEKGEPLPTELTDHGTPEVEALANALKNMASELQNARVRELEQQRLVTFREVARRVAHEIRGPLTSTRLAISQLEREGVVADGNDAFLVLKDETERLDDMAREFAEFGRLPEGPRATIDVCELIDSVLTSTVPPNVPIQRSTTIGLTLTGHYEPLRRALQNLVRNAIEATDQRGIAVSASEVAHSGIIELQVTDFGDGVAENQQDQIFEPYMTTKPRGTGLGLAIVKQVVEAHDGTVTVASSQDGATFTMQLPLNKP